MIASFRAEWLKFRKRPANLVLVLVLGGLMLILTYVLTYVILAHPPQRTCSRRCWGASPTLGWPSC